MFDIRVMKFSSAFERPAINEVALAKQNSSHLKPAP
jgi:hypothetical protein